MTRSFTDYNIHSAYDTMRVSYVGSPYHDNRSTYLWVTVECLHKGIVVHTIADYVVRLANRRLPGVVLYNMSEVYRLFEKLEELPSEKIEFIIHDLNAFLLATSQRIVCCLNEKDLLIRMKKCVRECPVSTYIKLGDYEPSRVFTQQCDENAKTMAKVTPTLERMGYTDRAHLARVREARQRAGLWR